MDKELFRRKSINRISSPEQLDDYVRVANPGVWMALVAVIVLLIGICVWGIFGKMDTTLSTVVVVKDGSAVCYVKENEIESVEAGQPLRVKGEEYSVESVSFSPVLVSADIDPYVMHIGSLSEGEWVYEVKLNATLTDGVYPGKIVTESVKPVSFVLN